MPCKKTVRRIVIIGIASLVLVLIVVGAIVGTSRNNEGRHNSGNSQYDESSLGSIKAVCDTTLYPGTCYSSLSPLVNSTLIKPDELLKFAVVVAINELSKASIHLDLRNCSELLDLALDHLNAPVCNNGI
ncbi:putative pectinesterase/pectinesterase inhibitor 24 [Tanacetum coccineum]